MKTGAFHLVIKQILQGLNFCAKPQKQAFVKT